MNFWAIPSAADVPTCPNCCPFHTKFHFSLFCGVALPKLFIPKPTFPHFVGAIWPPPVIPNGPFPQFVGTPTSEIDLLNSTFPRFGMSQPPKSTYQISLFSLLVCRGPFSRHHNSRKVAICGVKQAGGSGLARQGGPKPHQGAGCKAARPAGTSNTGRNRTRVRGARRRVQPKSVTRAQTTPNPQTPRPSRRNAAAGGDFACPRLPPRLARTSQHGPPQPQHGQDVTSL